MEACVLLLCASDEQERLAARVADLLALRFEDVPCAVCRTDREGGLAGGIVAQRERGCIHMLLQPLSCFADGEPVHVLDRALGDSGLSSEGTITLLDPLFDGVHAADWIEDRIRRHVPAVNRYREGLAAGEIQRKSFSLIEQGLAESFPDALEKDVVIRAVHAVADFTIANRFYFSEGAARAGVEAIRRGARIITDVTMTAAGIGRLFRDRTLCALSDGKTADLSSRLGITRSAAGFEMLKDRMQDAVVAVGNAPTALVHLLTAIREEGIRPALTVGVPVGFVGAAESKELLVESGEPCIVLRGKRGGSAIAAAVVNALGTSALEKDP
jgi:precorrin-8X/cobalt-precorrin-8 methylmutase